MGPAAHHGAVDQGERVGRDRTPQSGDADWLSFGPPPARSRRALLGGVAAAVIVALTLLGPAVSRQDRDTDRLVDRGADVQPTSAPGTAPAPGTVARRRLEPIPPTTTRPALPGAGSWVLFVRSPTTLSEVRLDSGRVTRTAVDLGSGDAPVSLVVGSDRVFLLPYGSGAGAVVPDGRPARALPASLRSAEQLFPGPAGSLWALRLSDTLSAQVRLTSYAGVSRSRLVKLNGAWPRSDGKDGVLLTDSGGVYRPDSSGTRRRDPGRLVATGSHHLLLESCDADHRCREVLLDRGTGGRRDVGPPDPSVAGGTLSPDGRHAALVRSDGGADRGLEVLDLRRHTSRPLPGRLPAGLDATASTAWTPDSRYLLAVLDGRLNVLDTRTETLRSVDLGPARLLQLGLRAG